MPLPPPPAGQVRMTNDALPGAEAYAPLIAYEETWYALGWRSPLDDPGFVGPSSLLSTIVDREVHVPLLRGTDTSGWVRRLFTADANAPDSALSFEHGQLVVRVVGGTGTQSNRREAWQIPDVPASEFSRIRTRWSSRPPADGFIQHGHMHRLQTGGDGKIRAVVFWEGLFGAPTGGVWQSNPDGTSFAVSSGVPILDSDNVTASSRTSNVVTLTVATGAQSRWKAGDAIKVDLTDATYDGSFVISTVTDTTIAYTQTAANDADGGTGNVTLLGKGDWSTLEVAQRQYAFTDAVRTSGVVISTGLAAGHPFQVGDRVIVDAADNTYDGNFAVSAVNQSTNQISWLQHGVADDPAAGAGTVTKIYPFWAESRLLPGDLLQARIWPDIGVDLNGGTAGPLPAGPPSWESPRWTMSWDVSQATGVTIPTEEGVCALVAAHLSSNSSVRYESIEAAALATR